MIIDTAKQGTLPWFIARAGVISASNFHLVRTSARMKTGAKKGEYSEKAKGLAFKLGIERISKLPLGVDEGFDVWQADRGRGLEPWARHAHEIKAGLLVEDAGFIRTDDGLFGATADGFAKLYEPESIELGCEYKCFLAPDKLRAILLDGDTDSVIDQCDGGMWITGLSLWHFGLYCPALNDIGLGFTLIPIERDDDRMEALEADLVTFNHAVQEAEARLRQRAGLNYVEPMAPLDPAAAATLNDELARVSAELPDNIFA